MMCAMIICVAHVIAKAAALPECADVFVLAAHALCIA